MPTSRSRFLPSPPAAAGWLPYLWLIYLAPVCYPAIAGHAGGWEVAGTGVALALFLWSYFHALHAAGRALVGHAALQLALGAVLLPWNPFAAVLVVYAASAAARLEPERAAWWAIAGVAGGGSLWALLLGAGVPVLVSTALVAPLIGAVTVHDQRVRRAHAALAAANARIATLATTAERERIARDLHDLLGHTLSLVVLKAQVARRLVGRDPDAVERELHELETAARGALTEVRRTIRGYRTTLDAELRAARLLLEAAGVAVDAEVRLAAPDPERDAVLAPVLRELTTNVARHAGARLCRIEIADAEGGVVLTVRDDGRGGAAFTGSGLRGIAERVHGAGGTVTIADPAPGPAARGSTITVVLPRSRADHGTPVPGSALAAVPS